MQRIRASPAGDRRKERHLVTRLYRLRKIREFLVHGSPHGSPVLKRRGVAGATPRQVVHQRGNGANAVRQSDFLLRNAGPFAEPSEVQEWSGAYSYRLYGDYFGVGIVSIFPSE